MTEKILKILTDTNKELKKKNFFKNYEITIDGDFTSEYNFIALESGSHTFPIATVATEGEAIAAVSAYVTGLRHGKDNSYPAFCDGGNR